MAQDSFTFEEAVAPAQPDSFTFEEALATPSRQPEPAHEEEADVVAQAESTTSMQSMRSMAAATRATVGTVGRAISAFDLANIYRPVEAAPVPTEGPEQQPTEEALANAPESDEARRMVAQKQIREGLRESQLAQRRATLFGVGEVAARAVNIFGALNWVGRIAGGLTEDLMQGRLLPTPERGAIPNLAATGAAITGQPDIGTPAARLTPVQQGLVEGVKGLPPIIAAGALVTAGVPPPAAYAITFGGTTLEETQDPLQAAQSAAVGAVLPGVGQAAKELGARVMAGAVKNGVVGAANTTVQKTVEAGAELLGIVAFNEALHAPGYAEMSPDERSAALQKSLASNLAFLPMILPGIFGRGRTATQEQLAETPPAEVAGRALGRMIEATELVNKDAPLTARAITEEGLGLAARHAMATETQVGKIRELREEGVTREDAEALVFGGKTVEQVVAGAFSKSITPAWDAGRTQVQGGHAEAWIAGYNNAVERLTRILEEPVKQPLTTAAAEAVVGKGPSASSLEEAAAVHGDLRTQPGRGPGQVPVEKGGPEVQPQAEGGLPPPGGGAKELTIEHGGYTYTKRGNTWYVDDPRAGAEVPVYATNPASKSLLETLERKAGEQAAPPKPVGREGETAPPAEAPPAPKPPSEPPLTKGEAKFAGYQFDRADMPSYQIPGARPGILRNVTAEAAREAGYTVPEKIPSFEEWKAAQVPKPEPKPEPETTEIERHLTAKTPETAEARSAVKVAEDTLSKLREEYKDLQKQLKDVEAIIKPSRGNAYTRSQIKKSAKKSDVATYNKLRRQLSDLDTTIQTIEERTRPYRKTLDEAIDAGIINDPNQPLARRIDRKIRMLEAQGFTAPPELIKARTAAIEKIIRDKFPDATPEEIKRLTPDVERGIYFGEDVWARPGMGPQISALRRAELDAAVNAPTVPKHAFSEELKAELNKYRTGDRPYSPTPEPVQELSAAKLAELKEWIKRETERVHEEARMVREQEAAAVEADKAKEEQLLADAERVVNSAKRVGTVGGRTALEVKEELANRILNEVGEIVKANDVKFRQGADEHTFVAEGEASSPAMGTITSKGDKFEVEAWSLQNPKDTRVKATVDTRADAEMLIKGMAAHGRGRAIIAIPGDGIYRLSKSGSKLLKVWSDVRKISIATGDKRAPYKTTGGAEKPPGEIRTEADWVQAKEFHGLEPSDKIASWSNRLLEFAQKVGDLIGKNAKDVDVRDVETWIKSKSQKPKPEPTPAEKANAEAKKQAETDRAEVETIRAKITKAKEQLLEPQTPSGKARLEKAIKELEARAARLEARADEAELSQTNTREDAWGEAMRGDEAAFDHLEEQLRQIYPEEEQAAPGEHKARPSPHQVHTPEAFVRMFNTAFAARDFDKILNAIKATSDVNIWKPMLKDLFKNQATDPVAARKAEWFRHVFAGTVPPDAIPKARAAPSPGPAPGPQGPPRPPGPTPGGGAGPRPGAAPPPPRPPPGPPPYVPPPRVAAAPITGGKPKSPFKIIEDFSAAIKKAVRVLRLRPSQLGVYRPGDTMTAQRFAGDLDTAAHELAGHWVDDKYGIGKPWVNPRTRSPYDNELAQFWIHGSVTPSSTLRYRRAEGIAEYIRAYVMNPAEARRLAPQFTAYFERTLPPEALKAINDFGKDVRTWLGADPLERGGVMMRMQPPTLTERLWNGVRGRGYGFQVNPLDRFLQMFSDKYHFAVKGFNQAREMVGRKLLPEQEFETMGRLLSGHDRQMEWQWKNGLLPLKPEQRVNARGNLEVVPLKDPVTGQAMNLDWLHGAFDKTNLETFRKSMRDTAVWMVYGERTLEKAGQLGRPSQISGGGAGMMTDVQAAREIIARVQSDPGLHMMVTEAARRYRLWADQNIQMLVDSGRITPEKAQQIRDKNEYYADMHRYSEEFDVAGFIGRARGSIGQVRQALKRFKGSPLEVNNIYANLLDQTDVIQREARRNMAMNAYVDILRNTRPLHGPDMRELEIFGRQVGPGNDRTIDIYKDGEVEHWQFEQPIYESLKGLSEMPTNALWRLATTPSRFARYMITHGPSFIARNVPRDALERTLNSVTGGKPWDILQGYTKEDLGRFEAFGGGLFGNYMRDRHTWNNLLERTARHLASDPKTILLAPLRMKEGWEALASKSETLGRLAEFRTAFEEGRKQLAIDHPNLSAQQLDYNAALYAAAEARGLMDFAKAGTVMKHINQAVPFSNAAMRGLGKSFTRIKEEPGRFAMRWGTYILLPTIAAMLWNRRDEETWNEYLQLPAYRRDLFWNLKVGDTWITIPKPHLMGVLAGGVERAILGAMGEKHAMEGYGRSAANAALPIADVGEATGPLKTFIELEFNRDTFRNRSIVLDWEKDLRMDLRKGAIHATGAGQGIAWALNEAGLTVDPRQADFVLRSLGGAGNIVANITTPGRSLGDTAVKAFGFTADAPSTEARDVQWVFDWARYNGQLNNPNVESMRQLRNAVFEAEGAEAKLEAGRELRKFATELREQIEADAPNVIEDGTLDATTQK